MASRASGLEKLLKAETTLYYSGICRVQAFKSKVECWMVLGFSASRSHPS